MNVITGKSELACDSLGSPAPLTVSGIRVQEAVRVLRWGMGS